LPCAEDEILPAIVNVLATGMYMYVVAIVDGAKAIAAAGMATAASIVAPTMTPNARRMNGVPFEWRM
jgi:hypothetical protein